MKVGHAKQGDHCHGVEMAIVIGHDDSWPLHGQSLSVADIHPHDDQHHRATITKKKRKRSNREAEPRLVTREVAGWLSRPCAQP